MSDIVLLVLSEKDSGWELNLSRPLKRHGIDVVTLDDIDEAVTFIQQPEFDAREIITGSFGDGALNGPWRSVYEAALARHIRITLITSADYSLEQLQLLQSEHVGLIQKRKWNPNQFEAERFPKAGQLETE